MSVLIDTSAISSVGASGATTQTFTNGGSPGFTMNLGSGPNGTSNRALIVAVIFIGAAGGTSSGVSCTWNGVSMTQLATAVNGGDIFLFGLRNPATGSNNVVVSWTGANQCAIALLSVVNADQSADATTFINRTTNTGTASPNSIAVTNPSGNIAVAGHVVVANYSTAGNTDIGHNNNGSRNSAAANYDTGVNPTLTYAFTSGTVWSSVGCSIAAVAGAAPAYNSPPPRNAFVDEETGEILAA
jgi:hypothetical protein